MTTTTAPPSTRRGAVGPILVAVALLAGCTAAGLGALALADALTATGLPDPGPITSYGLPFVRAAGEIAAVVAVGILVLSSAHRLLRAVERGDDGPAVALPAGTVERTPDAPVLVAVDDIDQIDEAAAACRALVR